MKTRVYSKLSPAGGDTNRGSAPWAVLAYRQAGLHRPHEAKQCDNLECTQKHHCHAKP